MIKRTIHYTMAREKTFLKTSIYSIQVDMNTAMSLYITHLLPSNRTMDDSSPHKLLVYLKSNC